MSEKSRKTNKLKTTNVSIALDIELKTVSGELLPNRSLAAQAGVLSEVVKQIARLNDELKKEYTERISHLL